MTGLLTPTNSQPLPGVAPPAKPKLLDQLRHAVRARQQTVHFKYSLAQLFLGVTVWSVCLGAIMAFFPAWVYGLLAVAAAIAIIVVFARGRTIVGMAFLSLPIVCLLNWSMFVIALEHAFGGTGIVTMLLGPIADFVSWPVVVAQNSVPLTRPWDTLFGIATISMIEAAALILLITVWRKRPASSPAAA